MDTRFFITTAIPYVNAAPHIGHALEFVQVDALARIKRLEGADVLMLTGSDENALKNVQAAEKAGKPVQEFIDGNALIFQRLATSLDVHFDVFQKGSNRETHFPSSQELWNRCRTDIYKKEYKGLYCVGCEAFYTEDELDSNGQCHEHPGKKLDMVSETNYFFRLSAYQEKIKELISTDTLKILPDYRKNEVLKFLEKPLQDISISRSNSRARNWGVPVPNDDTQRIYVWFDALNIYQSGIGFGWDEKMYKKWWPADVHAIGKGITRFHAVYWPAFLLSAKLPIPKSLFVHGYITVNGQKMSKTVGNVIDPFELIQKYGIDAVRYYLLREIPTFADGDYSDRRMKELYNSELANELGNLVSRITTIAAKDGIELEEPTEKPSPLTPALRKLLEKGELDTMIKLLWEDIRSMNKKTNDFEPWKKTTEERREFLLALLREIRAVSYRLTPYIPGAAAKILTAVSGKITKSPPLFPRIA